MPSFCPVYDSVRNREARRLAKVPSIALSLAFALLPFNLAQGETGMLAVDGDKIEYGVYEPRGEPLADVLFLHGLFDDLSQFQSFYQELNRQGLRVITLSLPLHGKTETDLLYSWIAPIGTRDLAIAASQVWKKVGMRAPRPANRPLILSGFSMGGLLALRMAQSPSQWKGWGFNTAPSGLLLFAPAVFPRWPPRLPDWNDNEERESLMETSIGRIRRLPHLDPPHYLPLFLESIYSTAKRAQSMDIPPTIRTRAWLAGDEDSLVDTRRVLAWLNNQKRRGASVSVSAQAGAKHDIISDLDPARNTALWIEASQAARQIALGQDPDHCPKSFAPPAPN